MFSSEACKDKSCKIIRDIENKELGVLIIAPISNRTINRIAIAFVDDTSLYRNGESVQNKIQQIIDWYATLYEATGRKIEEQKSYFYAWQWKEVGGKLLAAELEVRLSINQ